jgi:hypothetical protein
VYILSTHCSREQRQRHTSLLIIFGKCPLLHSRTRDKTLIILCPDFEKSLRILDHFYTSGPERSLLHISSRSLTLGHRKPFHHTQHTTTFKSPTLGLQTLSSHNTSKIFSPDILHFYSTLRLQITQEPPAKMVKWENDKNVYILGAALGALGTTISSEVIQAIRADWRMLSLPLSSPSYFLVPFPTLSHFNFVLSNTLFLSHSSPSLFLPHFSFPISYPPLVTHPSPIHRSFIPFLHTRDSN